MLLHFPSISCCSCSCSNLRLDSEIWACHAWRLPVSLSLYLGAGGNVVELDAVIFEFDNSYSWWTASALNLLSWSVMRIVIFTTHASSMNYLHHFSSICSFLAVHSTIKLCDSFGLSFWLECLFCWSAFWSFLEAKIKTPTGRSDKNGTVVKMSRLEWSGWHNGGRYDDLHRRW